MMRKRMHFYWGNRTMSFLRYMSIHSFSRLNPEWETVLIRRRKPVPFKYGGWNERPDFLHFKGEDCTKMLDDLDITVRYIEDECPKLTEMNLPDLHISDLLQWHILSETGGAFSDTDVIFFRPMEYDMIRDADVGLVSFSGNPKPNYIPSSFVIGRPCRFFSEMAKWATDGANHSRWESCGSDAIRMAFGDIGGIRDAFPELNVVRLPSRIVFPFAETERKFTEYASLAFCRNTAIPNDSIGIHWYGSGAIAQRFNNTITKDNYKKYDSTICRLVGDVL